jgi:hypothetical protein
MVRAARWGLAGFSVVLSIALLRPAQAIGAEPAAPPNLIRNGGFEELAKAPKGAESVFVGWTNSNDKRPVKAAVKPGCAGKQCAEFLAGPDGECGVVSEMAPVKAGENYAWSFRVLMTEAQSDGAHLEFYWFNQDKERIAINTVSRHGSANAEWVKVEGQITAPEKAAFVNAYLRSFAAKSPAYVDDFTFAKAPPAK